MGALAVGISGSGPTIFCIVDDSRVIRKVAAKIAISLGYRVIEAEDGAEGLARCKQAMPDLVLTDWQMPVIRHRPFFLIWITMVIWTCTRSINLRIKKYF